MLGFLFYTHPETKHLRVIVIDTDTIRELKEWKEVQQKVLKDCRFVMSYSGVPTSKHTLPRALNKLAELAGATVLKFMPYGTPTPHS